MYGSIINNRNFQNFLPKRWIHRRLSRCKQLGGLVLVVWLGVPLRCKASKLGYPLNIPPIHDVLLNGWWYWLLYISTSVWVLHILSAGQNMLFNIFEQKNKMQKWKKFIVKFNKKPSFLSLHQNAGWVFYSKEKGLTWFVLFTMCQAARTNSTCSNANL